jgi:apolipoprotein D and lipocalin family protein
MNAPRQWLVALLAPMWLSACSNMPTLQPVDEVDLERFMGDWYVVANIPTALEKGAHNAVESYRLNGDGSVATTFTFRDGSFDGEKKAYHPRGFVRSESNAVWGMQFVWPIKADYRIIWLDEDYGTTVIGRNRRDYLWIMARTPRIPDAKYRQILEYVESVGYDLTEVQKVPQQW